nr:hypothetical protein [Tanacetum cinerariifolium]
MGVLHYALWEVILNGNSAVQMTKDEAGNEVEVPCVTAQQILANTRERKAKSTLFMDIPDEHLARFHGIKDAKALWAAIKTKFGEGLEKGYDRFQRLLSLLEIHRAGVSTEDANQKNLRSLPSAWSNISLIIKPDIDNLYINDHYNNLKVYEVDIKGYSRSSSNLQSVAFVSVESTSSTNELNAAYSAQGSSSYADELMFSFFANQSSSPQLDNEDLEQIDQDDLEEMDLKWQVAMLSMSSPQLDNEDLEQIDQDDFEEMDLKWQVAMLSMRDCRIARNLENMSRDAGNAGYRGRYNGKRHAREEDEKALVVQDRLSTYDWSYQVEDKATGFALMAFTSNPSSSSSSNSEDHPHQALKNKGIVDSWCSRYMTGNKAYLVDYQEINDGGFVTFGSSRVVLSSKKLVLPGKVSAAELPLEKFWNTATSQTMNDEKQINAIVDGKTVVITKSSVRRDLHFTDANEITCLTTE